VELAVIDPELARLVDCRYFAGLTEAEAAQVLGVSDRTIRRWWIRARAWLHREIRTG
jgi:DNA-directed RNA polymerase specialized sigma24 family protein